MGNSRSYNSKRNMIAGVAQRGINILLQFINRTIILWILGAEYQGLSSLFTSILQVLSMAELGLSTAIVYSMYKPIAEGDKDKVNALLLYFKKAYRIIGICILGIGIVLLPFLPKLISGSVPGDINIYVLYLMYLGNTVISYLFFAYKSTILEAHQRNDIVNNIQAIVKVIECIIQMIILLIFKNYYLYILVMPLFTLLNNFLIAFSVNRKFPEYAKPYGKVDSDSKKALSKQVSGLMVSKVGDVARNSFDSIIISSLLGLISVAIYSNYYYIYSSLYTAILVVVNAMSASVGDSIARENQEKNHKDFMKLTFGFSWFIGWCTVCLFCLYQPFMKLWVGADLMLSFKNMACFCAYFYLIGATCVRNLYLNGNGLWWKLKIQYVLEAVSNLVLNFVLGYYLGIFGVLLATIITILLFNIISRTNILYKCYFTHFSLSNYSKNQLLYAACTIINCIICFLVSSKITVGGMQGLCLIIVLCIILPNLIYWILFHRMKIYRLTVDWVKIRLKTR